MYKNFFFSPVHRESQDICMIDEFIYTKYFVCALNMYVCSFLFHKALSIVHISQISVGTQKCLNMCIKVNKAYNILNGEL